MFSVVEFSEESVSVVRTEWFTPRKQNVFWPPIIDTHKFDTVLRKGKPAVDSETWELNSVKRCFYKTGWLCACCMRFNLYIFA